MTDFQHWLDRINTLLQMQKDLSLDLISANFTRRELIELKMMVEVLAESTTEPTTPHLTVDEYIRTRNKDND